MIDIQKAVAIAKVALHAVEVLEAAVKTAQTALAAGKAQLKDALAELEQMREKLAGDRSAADKALEDKFR